MSANKGKIATCHPEGLSLRGGRLAIVTLIALLRLLLEAPHDLPRHLAHQIWMSIGTQESLGLSNDLANLFFGDLQRASYQAAIRCQTAGR